MVIELQRESESVYDDFKTRKLILSSDQMTIK